MATDDSSSLGGSGGEITLGGSGEESSLGGSGGESSLGGSGGRLSRGGKGGKSSLGGRGGASFVVVVGNSPLFSMSLIFSRPLLTFKLSSLTLAYKG